MLRRLHREEHQLLLLGIQVLTILLLRQVVVWRVCRVEDVKSVESVEGVKNAINWKSTDKSQ